mmetsp:Transcript_22773/g.68458  ORF Transcript_22773/g.68458 Transcript_22773/m.68458 type:complete len:225 (+) Transcript_22773:641-1315(+)
MEPLLGAGEGQPLLPRGRRRQREAGSGAEARRAGLGQDADALRDESARVARHGRADGRRPRPRLRALGQVAGADDRAEVGRRGPGEARPRRGSCGGGCRAQLFRFPQCDAGAQAVQGVAVDVRYLRWARRPVVLAAAREAVRRHLAFGPRRGVPGPHLGVLVRREAFRFGRGHDSLRGAHGEAVPRVHVQDPRRDPQPHGPVLGRRILAGQLRRADAQLQPFLR